MNKQIHWSYEGVDDLHHVDYEESKSGTLIQLPTEENKFNLKVTSGGNTILDCHGMNPDFIKISPMVK